MWSFNIHLNNNIFVLLEVDIQFRHTLEHRYTLENHVEDFSVGFKQMTFASVSIKIILCCAKP